MKAVRLLPVVVTLQPAAAAGETATNSVGVDAVGKHMLQDVKHRQW
jgi:hypothetical protein